MRILNLGCSVKTSNSPNVINIDWSIALLIKKNFLMNTLANIFLSFERRKKIKSLPTNILVHDLSKGIPFENDSIDVVYHSHLLEHIDRKNVKNFLLEIKRVLKPNGIHRIVVPDFYFLCSQYVKNYKLYQDNKKNMGNHDNYISDIIEQSVRKESSGASKQKPIIRLIENTLLGDARRKGETHQWMYDKINLEFFLKESGFSKIKEKSYLTSDIEDWINYGLDIDDFKNEYKKGSLYIEARK